MSPEPLLQADDLRVTFQTGRGAVCAVDGVSFDIGRGERLGLVGESGSGKSALATAVIGLLPGYARIDGSLLFDGEQLRAAPPRRLRLLRGRRIGMVFQDPNASLNPVRKVGAQLVETLRVLCDLSRAQARSTAIDLLRQVGLPEPHRQLAAYPHELSGGMRQRVMIALALAGEPDLLIADEATTALDVSVQAQILELLDRVVAERNMSLLLITHDLGVAASVTDRIAVMYSGRLAEVGTTSAVFAAPRHPYTHALLRCIPSLDEPPHETMEIIAGQAPDPLERPSGCAFAARCPLAHEHCVQEHPPLSVRPAGLRDSGTPGSHVAACWATETSAEPLADSLRAADHTAGRRGAAAARRDGVTDERETVLSVSNLSVRYRIRKPLFSRGPRHLVAVRDVTFEVRAGETLGLVGESGSGKSSVAGAVLRLGEGTSGTIQFEGQDIYRMPARRLRRLRARLQMVLQDITTSLSPRFTVAQAIGEPLRAHAITPPGGTAAFVRRLLADVSLSGDLADRSARELSGGQRQRVNLARALATGPRLIVADEPTSALDVSVRAQILNLMKAVQRDRDLAYIFISHDLTVIRQMSDRVAVMYLGKIVEVAGCDQLFTDPQHPYTRALLAAVPTVGDRTISAIAGEPPSPLTPPSGCPFRTRCPRAQQICAEQEPPLDAVRAGQRVACFFPGAEASSRRDATVVSELR